MMTTTLAFQTLAGQPRLLITAKLKPMQGTRFQPTGFPDLGAAAYTLADGTEMLLVESAQSMANRMEAVCWDDNNSQPVAALEGLPFVVSRLPDGSSTSSILEAHRLNSPFIIHSPEFKEVHDAIGFQKNQPFNRKKLANALLKYDPSSLLHGVFLEKIGGVVRLPRALSGFIEARNARVASSGGVKVDRVQPETSGKVTPYGKAADGYGNVPFHRDEYTGEISAYFNLDLALLRGYGFDEACTNALVVLALYKIRQLLAVGLRLRTSCDLEVDGEVSVTKPVGFTLPALNALEAALSPAIQALVQATGGKVLEVRYDTKKAKQAQKESTGGAEEGTEE
jgi:CRISPR-associated protein Csb1